MKRTTRLKEPQVPEIGDLINFDELGGRPKYDGVEMTSETNIPSVSAETEARQAADQEIWTEIDAIEASSDVVDIVGTYADLEQYDTSHLKNNDIIKVIADETHDDATSYYRYNTTTSTFSYVGSEGPYYTQTEVDTLVGGKQDKLVAGSNITIASDGKTISATDTTYSTFTGATSGAAGTSGLVPAPAAGDQNKVLKADGTWVDLSNSVLFMVYDLQMLYDHHVYPYTRDGSTPAPLTHDEVTAKLEDALRKGKSIYVYWHDSSEIVWEVVSTGFDCNDFTVIDNAASISTMYTIYGDTNPQDPQDDTYFKSSATQLQPVLTAGSNISINDNTISATDTTYSAFTGTDGQTAGAAGLVPAPAVADDGKYLNADGTWQSLPTTPTFSGATAQDSGAAGLVPAPMAGEQDKYLKANGLWSTISVSLPIASSVDLGGIKVGTNLSIDGTTGVLSAVDTTYSAFTGATSSVAGAAGLVPAPAAGDDDKYLKGDGTWGTVSGGTTSDFTGATSSTAGVHGLVPAPAAGDDVKYLKGDGSWATITANNISSNDWSGLWQ